MNFLTARFRRLLDVNPVTLKELRQLVRSRIILWSMFLFPVALLVVNALVVSASLPQATPDKDAATLAYETLMATAGPGVLVATTVLLGIVTAVVIPLMTGVRLTLETGRARMDLQFVTALTAQDIVNGKLMAAFLVSLTFTALALPFLTLAYLLRGIELATVGWTALAVVAASAFMSAVTAAVGALRMPIGLRMAFLFGGYAAFGVWGLMILAFLIVEMAFGNSTGGVSVPTVMLVALGILTCGYLLARAWAAANLMPTHTDNMRALRRTEAVLLAVFWTATLVTAVWTGEEDYALPIPIVTSLVLTVIGALALFRPSEVPRVVAAHAPKSFLGRFFTYPFTSTAAAGALFVALAQLVTLAVFAGAAYIVDDRGEFPDILRVTLAIYGEITLVALAVMLVFRACRAGRRLFAFGPLIVFGVMQALQLASILESTNVIESAGAMFGFLGGIISDDNGDKALHLIYTAVALAVLLAYLMVDVTRTFRRFRRPETAAK